MGLERKIGNVKAKIPGAKAHPAAERVARRLAGDDVEKAACLLQLLDEDGRLSTSDWMEVEEGIESDTKKKEEGGSEEEVE